MTFHEVITICLGGEEGKGHNKEPQTLNKNNTLNAAPVSKQCMHENSVINIWVMKVKTTWVAILHVFVADSVILFPIPLPILPLPTSLYSYFIIHTYLCF
jgi:hypothetical protein